MEMRWFCVPTWLGWLIAFAHVPAIVLPMLEAKWSLEVFPFQLNDNDVMIASALMMVGSTFEIAQNAAKQWYFLSLPATFNTWMFASMISLSSVFTCMAFNAGIFVTATCGLLALLPLFAFPQLGPNGAMAIMGITGLLAAIAMFMETFDWAALLILPPSVQVIIVYLALVATHCQPLHAVLALSSAATQLAQLQIMVNGAAGTPWTWGFGVLVVSVWLSLLLCVTPVLFSLPKTTNLCTDLENAK